MAALWASYFDIWFAVSRLPHPGGERLLDWVEERCRAVPLGMHECVYDVLCAAVAQDSALLGYVDALLDGLDDLLRAEGFPIDDALSL